MSMAVQLPRSVRQLTLSAIESMCVNLTSSCCTIPTSRTQWFCFYWLVTSQEALEVEAAPLHWLQSIKGKAARACSLLLSANISFVRRSMQRNCFSCKKNTVCSIRGRTQCMILLSNEWEVLGVPSNDNLFLGQKNNKHQRKWLCVTDRHNIWNVVHF